MGDFFRVFFHHLALIQADADVKKRSGPSASAKTNSDLLLVENQNPRRQKRGLGVRGRHRLTVPENPGVHQPQLNGDVE